MNRIFYIVYCTPLTGEDMMKLEGSYNQAQRTWMDDMINACRVSLEIQLIPIEYC